MPESVNHIPTSLRKRLPQPEALKLIPEAMARKYQIIPISVENGALHVAMTNPSDILALEALASWSGMRIEPEPASRDEIFDAIDFNYKAYDEIEKQISSISNGDITTNRKGIISPNITIADSARDAPVAQALNLIIEEAIKAHASDVHLQPGEDQIRVRFRIDGTLHELFQLPLSTLTPIISRIKILANLNIADHHRPQDGQFSMKAKGRLVDIRVGIIATVYGEMAVLRLLDKARAQLALSDLGFLTASLHRLEDMLKVPYGMILVSGPTGAGKTTTLYAALNSLEQTERNIITVEDPVEYRFPNINQIQVNPRAGITFASGLRSILRLDPDVILIGEIRDAETANIAIQSALTGHLVLSSIHANDAIGVILRLIDLGIEPFLVASAVIGVISQRMARRICPECGVPKQASPEEILIYQREMGEERSEFVYGNGCPSCSGSGYRGRTGIFEVLAVTESIKTLILREANAHELRKNALNSGMVTLLRDGMEKVRKDITNPIEILRNAYSVG